MSRTVSATEARIHLGELLDDIERNEAITAEREGTAEAVIVSTSEYQRLRNDMDQEEDWWDLAKRSREAFRRHLGDREVPSAVDLIREGREERDAQLLDTLR